MGLHGDSKPFSEIRCAPRTDRLIVAKRFRGNIVIIRGSDKMHSVFIYEKEIRRDYGS